MTGRRWGTVCVAASAVLVLTGCQWSGLNSVSLPGAAGRGEGSFSVVIEMPDVTSISPNSPVMVNDVTVGSISAIETDNWHARVTVALDGSVSLPANATARSAKPVCSDPNTSRSRRPPRWRRKGGCRRDP